jgi:hypothetical protein
MATYKHLRSSTANKRPTTTLVDGQLAINTNTASPGLFFKDSAGTGIVKVGPVHVGTTAPNSTPASGGSTGNYTGEQWLDTSVSPAQMKVWNGSTWVGIVADELPVSKLADGAAGQIIQTDAAGTGVEWSNTVNLPLGNAAAPSYRFQGDGNTGIYSPGADNIAISNGGITRFTITDSGIVRIGPGSTQTIANVPIASDVHFDGLAPTPDASNSYGVAIVSRGGAVLGGQATEALTFYSAGWDSYAAISHGTTVGGDGLTLAGCDFITIDALVSAYVKGATSVEIQTGAGGTQRLVAKTTELVINDNASDYDFRVEGTANQYLLCVDALTNTVVINGANGLNYGPLQVDAETDDQAIAIRCHAVGNEGGKLVIASNSAGVEYLRLYSNSVGSSLDARNKLTFTVGDPVGTGSVDRLSIGFSETVINETGANYDFRIEGDTNANLFFVDASTERIGIGTSSPGSALEINAAAATSPFIAKINTAEVARIDSSGRLLVGTSSGYVTSTSATTQPLLQIHSTNTHEAQVSINSWSTGTATGANLSLCRSDSGTVGTHTAVGSTDVLGAIRFSGSDGDQFIEGASITASADGTWGDNDGPTKLVFSVTADGLPSPTEALRISSDQSAFFSGRARFGASSGYTDTAQVSIFTSAAVVGCTFDCGATSLERTHVSFENSNGIVGTIKTSGSATSYNTSSDYRLKENVVPLTGAIDRLQQIPVHRFNFIADPDTTVDGFIAHEAQAVVPECVTGTKDEVDADGNPVYQGIDQSKLVPLLTAALQEALAEIESLKARLDAAGI